MIISSSLVNNNWVELQDAVINNTLPILPTATLLSLCTTCKEWNRVITQTLDQKSLEVYQDERLISPRVFNQIFHDGCISSEEEREAIRTLPPNLLDINCPIYPKYKLIDTHYIIWIPEKIYNEALSIESYGNFCLGEKYPDSNGGYSYCSSKITDEHKQERSEKKWVALSKREVFSGTTIHQEAWKNKYARYKGSFDVPLLTGVVALSMVRFKDNNLLVNEKYIKCRDKRLDTKLNLTRDGLDLSCDRPAHLAFFGHFTLPHRPISVKSLPDVAIQKVFFGLHLNTLKKCFSVSKHWNQLTHNFVVQKRENIYQNPLVIGPKVVNSMISQNCISDVEEKKAISLIPLNLFDNAMMNSHYYVWIPEAIEGTPFQTSVLKPELLQKKYVENNPDSKVSNTHKQIFDEMDRSVRTQGWMKQTDKGYWKFIKK